MLKHNYGEAYIRRLRKGDTCDSIITSYRTAGADIVRKAAGKHAYVLVRRGFPGQVLEADFTKQALIDRLTWNGHFDLKERLRWFRCERVREADQ